MMSLPDKAKAVSGNYGTLGVHCPFRIELCVMQTKLVADDIKVVGLG